MDMFHGVLGTRLLNFINIQETLIFCLKQVFHSPGLSEFAFLGDEASLPVNLRQFGPIARTFQRDHASGKNIFSQQSLIFHRGSFRRVVACVSHKFQRYRCNFNFLIEKPVGCVPQCSYREQKASLRVTGKGVRGGTVSREPVGLESRGKNLRVGRDRVRVLNVLVRVAHARPTLFSGLKPELLR